MGIEGAEAVHVVVRFDDRQAGVHLPADRPIAELVPELLLILFGAQDAAVATQFPWLISLPNGEPLHGASTLRELRIVDGTPLLLEPVEDWQPDEVAPGPAPAAEPFPVAHDHLPPAQRTQAALPERQAVARRLADAVGAALTPEPVPPLPPPAAGGYVSPAQLTLPRRPGGLRRGRVHWRESAYGRRLEQVIQGPQLRRCVTIAVMSPKGGVGKTAVSALLGTLFALLRRDRIVAVDSNPDFGSLGRCLTPGHGVFVDDLLTVLDERAELTATALDALLGRAVHGLMVLPAPNHPARMARLDEGAYLHVVHRLQGMVGMVLLDCGTGLYDAAARAALRVADQVLLVTDGDPTTASLVADAAGLLRGEDVPVWLIANRIGRGSRLELSALETFVPHANGLLVLPEDRNAAARVATGTFDWRDAPASWHIAVREIAAALAAAWPELGLAG